MKQGSDAFSDRDWINHIWKGSSRTPFQHCQNSCGTLCIRALQEHTGERFDRTRVDGSCRNTIQLETILISPRMLIQLEVNLGSGTHCMGKESRAGRQTVFFTSLDPWGNEIEEHFQGDMSKP